MKIKIIFFFIALLVLLVNSSSCNNIVLKEDDCNDQKHTKEAEKVMPEGDLDEYDLTHELNYDIDTDGFMDKIKVFASYAEGRSSINSILLKVDNDKEKIEIRSGVNMELISNITILNKETENTSVLIELTNEKEAFDYKGQALVFLEKKSNFIIFTYKNDRITVLCNSIDFSINKNDNYSLKHLDSGILKFTDKSTNFDCKYQVKIPEHMKGLYLKRLSHLNEMDMSEISQSFNRTDLSDIDSDGNEEIVCYKYIPGVMQGDILGEISYVYKYVESKSIYYLVKQSLTYEKEVHKEQLYEET